MIDPGLSGWAHRWGLELDEAVGASYSDTWFARRGGEHVVIKAGDPAARVREAIALREYAEGGAPVCALLAAEPGVLLLERILPGDDVRPLAAVDDDAATAVIGDLIASLHASVEEVDEPDGLPHLGTIAVAFDTPTHGRAPIPRRLVEAAADLVSDLCGAAAPATVLHGDLHHRNVLREGWDPTQCRWRAIDPHGWWGDPSFDAVAMLLDLHDPQLWAGLTDDQVYQRAMRRIGILCERAGLSGDRLISWAAAGAVISELWCWEDHHLVQGWPQRLAEVLLARS